MKTAINPETGAILYQSGDEWKPAQMAVNPSTGEKLYLHPEGGDWRPVPLPASTDRGLGTAMSQVPLFGFADEIRGAAGATADVIGGLATPGEFGERYTNIRDQERAAQDRFAAENPLTNIGGQVAAGLATGGFGGAAGAASKTGQELLRRLPGMSMPQRLGTMSRVGATAGAGGGALAGAGEAPSLRDVPRFAATGAGTGATIGAIPGVGMSLPAGGAAAARAFNPERAAARQINKAIGRSGMSPDEALQAAQAGGPRGMLADVSEATRGALETTTQQAGAARGMAMDVLTPRSRAAIPDLLGSDAVGGKRAALSAIADVRANEASPLYEQAYAAGVEHTPELESLFEDIQKAVPGIWEKAKGLGMMVERNAGRDLPPGALGDARPSLRGWQYIKEALDDVVEPAISGQSAAGRRYGRALRDTKNRLLKALDKQSDDYAEARQLWAGSARFEELMKDSRRFMSESADDFIDRTDNLSNSELEAVRVGALQAVVDRVERGQWTEDTAKYFRTPAMERKLKALFRKPGEFKGFMQRVDNLTQQQRTYDAVRGQSATARRLAMAADSDDWIADVIGMGVDAATGGMPTTAPGLLRRGAQWAGSRAGGYLPSGRESARNRMAAALLEQNPATRARMALQREQILSAPLQVPGTTGLLGVTAPGTAGLLGGMLGGQLLSE